ncbi:MAG: alpha/beta hydrolase [Armatimonadota bacterium]
MTAKTAAPGLPRSRQTILALLALSLATSALIFSPWRSHAQQKPSDPASSGEPQIVFERDVVYGRAGGEELKLDLARPASGTGPFPVVVWYHGGGWQAGKKSDSSGFIRRLAGLGFVAASVEYRFAPRFPFPAQIEDAKCAVRYLRSRAAELHLDPNRFASGGESAGGHLALLVGLTKPSDGLEGTGGHAEQSSRVQAVINYVGPTDFRLLKMSTPPPGVEEMFLSYYKGKTGRQVMLDFLGSLDPNAPVIPRVSPVTYVDAGDPPVLAFYGAKDPLVPPVHGETLDKALKKAGVDSQMVIVPEGGHGWTGRDKERTDRITLGFLERYLR